MDALQQPRNVERRRDRLLLRYPVGQDHHRDVNANCGGVKTSISPVVNATGKAFKVYFRVSDLTKLSKGTLYVTSDNLSSAFGYAQFDSALTALEAVGGNEWLAATLSWDDFSWNAATNRAALNGFQLLFADKGTGAITVHFGGLSLFSEPANGIISINFDDGYQSVHDAARAMRAYGYRGTAYPICDGVGSTNNMTLPMLRVLADRGWDIGTHAYAAASHTAGLNTMADADVLADWELARQWFDRNLPGQGRVFAWPKGQ